MRVATLNHSGGDIPNSFDIVSTIKACSDKLFESLNKRRNMRNAVAHGQIVNCGMRNKVKARLIPPLLDTKRINKSIKEGQWPGMPANDVVNGTLAIRECCACIGEMQTIVQTLNSPLVVWRPLLDILLPLANRLRISHPLLTFQIPPAPSSPPPS
jgi:hypothetical protein